MAKNSIFTIIIDAVEQRIYYGNLTSEDITRNLLAHFNRGNLRVHVYGSVEKRSIQIATIYGASSGGQTALTISLQTIEDGIAVQVGKQSIIGVAASLGWTVLAAMQNIFSLLGRLDDLAQDIEYLQLSQEVWTVIETTIKNLGATHELSDRLRRIVCSYCETANPVGEPRCIACGAPLGNVQPVTCKNCGYVLKRNENICPNCKAEN